MMVVVKAVARKICLFLLVALLVLSSILITYTSKTEDEEYEEKNMDISRYMSSEIKYNLALMTGWFTENRGQVENPEVHYIFGDHDCSVGFIESGYILKLVGDDDLVSLVRVSFDGSNPVIPEGRQELSHRSNYFYGKTPSGWRTNVPNYKELVYKNLYDGIDLIFHTTDKGLKYDFLISPSSTASFPTKSARPSVIRYNYEGAALIYVDDSGNLHITTSSGELVEEAPFSYQREGNKKVEISSNYAVEHNTVFFEIGAYNPLLELVIDPLFYSTYIGGRESDEGWSIALDSCNNVYVTGDTISPDFPTTTDCYDDSYASNGHNDEDVFVFKLNHNGTDLLYSTFIGGSDGPEFGRDLIVDSEDNVYITGETYSEDFPTTVDCFDSSFSGQCDVFVTKLNHNGSDLTYSTYVGGGNYDLVLCPSNRQTYI